MALICMVVYVTEENNKADCFLQAYLSTINAMTDQDRLVLSINAITKEAYNEIEKYRPCTVKFHHNYENIGTSAALNQVIAMRLPAEHVVKIDDDVEINYWQAKEVFKRMEEVIKRDPKIGVLGLKRKDLIQHPGHPDINFVSELVMMPHQPGEEWIIVERTADIMGTCTMFNSALLDRVGYSRQPGMYGFEDNLMCHRSHLAGFYNCFLPQIEINHLDKGDTPFQKWKEKHSGELFSEYHRLVHAMIKGIEPIYYNPFEK